MKLGSSEREPNVFVYIEEFFVGFHIHYSFLIRLVKTKHCWSGYIHYIVVSGHKHLNSRFLRKSPSICVCVRLLRTDDDLPL